MPRARQKLVRYAPARRDMSSQRDAKPSPLRLRLPPDDLVVDGSMTTRSFRSPRFTLRQLPRWSPRLQSRPKHLETHDL